MRIVRSQLFVDSFRALQQGDPALFEVVAADLRYLLNRRRESQLPQVRFGIVQSAFRDVMVRFAATSQGSRRSCAHCS